MSLKQKHIEKFKVLYKQETDESVSDQEAWEMATNLLEYAKLLLEIAEQPDGDLSTPDD